MLRTLNLPYFDLALVREKVAMFTVSTYEYLMQSGGRFGNRCTDCKHSIYFCWTICHRRTWSSGLV
jgi:hypothetical protein